MTSSIDALGSCPYVPLSEYNWEIVPLFSEARGACHGITLSWNPTVVCLFAALHAVAVWMALGLNIQTVTTFKRWSTVYFWSIIITAWGIILYAVVIDLMFFTMIGDMLFLGSILYPLAWILTNTGFLMVLYSRLHLMLDRPRLLKTLLFIILGVGVPLQIFMVVAGTGSPHHLGDKVWQVTFRLEMIFVFLEIILSALYVSLFFRFLRHLSGVTQKQTNWTLCLLILGEVFVVAGDVAIVTLWYDGLYLLRLALSSFIYALKLKVEFMILNRLTSIKKREMELRLITLSAVGEETSAAVAGADPPSPTMKMEESLEKGVMKQSSAPGSKPALSVEIQEISTSPLRYGCKERSDSFDSIERRYLGRFSGTDGIV